jgi:TAZ zinc finger
MDAAFLDRLRVAPGEEAAVMERIEAAATQVATALVCIANPVDSQSDTRDWRLLLAYQVSLDIVHRAMSSQTRQLNAVSEELPSSLVLTLVQHPMLNHILIALDYIHVLLSERSKRNAWLQQLHNDGTTDQGIQAFAIEAVWSLLTSTTTAPDPHGMKGNNDIQKGQVDVSGEGSSYPVVITNKANSQSPLTVEIGKERPPMTAAVTCTPKPMLFSPLLSVPVWVRPRSTENVDGEQKKTNATAPRAQVSPTLPVQLPLPTKADSDWTISEKESHQATRLFRLHHAAECKDPNCTLPSCASMKHVLRCCMTPSGVACPHPFCFGAKCAISHLQSCRQSNKCVICRDYWERVACHQLATNVEQGKQTSGAPKAAPDDSSERTLKRQRSGVFEEPQAKTRRSNDATQTP